MTPALSELSALNQWVLWRAVEREGKSTKLPFQPTGVCASSTDPLTWCSHDHVLKHVAKYDGISFALDFTDPYVCIDLDHSVEAGTIVPWAQTIVNDMDSYTEFSPSGTGLHIWIKAHIPGDRKRTGKIEIYEAQRFMTWTGDHVPNTPETINERQSELNVFYAKLFPASTKPLKKLPVMPADLDDAQLIEKASHAKNADKFNALWSGDTSLHEGNDSQADQALCNHLAFWCACDVERMDTLFRQSGLYRKKWEREDYRTRTIAHAVYQCRETYTVPDTYMPNVGRSLHEIPPRSNGNGTHMPIDEDTPEEPDVPAVPRFMPLSVAELYEAADRLPKREWVVKNLISEGCTHIMSAPPKAGKTWGALALAHAVATGGQFGIDESIRQGTVLWIDEEMGLEQLPGRMRRMGIPPDARMMTMCRSKLKLDHNGDVAELLKIIEDIDPVLIVIDSLRRVHDLDENDNSKVKALFPRFKDIAELGPAVLILHHDRKKTMWDDDDTERASGAQDWTAQVDVVLGLHKYQNEYVIRARATRLCALDACPIVSFTLIDEDFETMRIQWNDPAVKKIELDVMFETRVLTYLQMHDAEAPFQTTQIVAACDGKAAELSAAIHRLLGRGSITLEKGLHNKKLYRAAPL